MYNQLSCVPETYLCSSRIDNLDRSNVGTTMHSKVRIRVPNLVDLTRDALCWNRTSDSEDVAKQFAASSVKEQSGSWDS